MKRLILVAVLCGTTLAMAQAPNLKGKMKAGEYEYTVSMEMGKVPGMPEGMQGFRMPATTIKHCITQKDIDDGNQKALGQSGKDMPKDCEMKDFKSSGDTVSYKMICKGETKMEMDATMTFTGNGMKGTTKMKTMQNGQPMNMISNMEAKYLGACKS